MNGWVDIYICTLWEQSQAFWFSEHSHVFAYICTSTSHRNSNKTPDLNFCVKIAGIRNSTFLGTIEHILSISGQKNIETTNVFLPPLGTLSGFHLAAWRLHHWFGCHLPACGQCHWRSSNVPNPLFRLSRASLVKTSTISCCNIWRWGNGDTTLGWTVWDLG